MSNFGKDNGSRSPDVRSKSSLSSSSMLKSSALPWHSASNPQIGRATSPWSNSRKNSIGIGCTPANFRSSLPDGLKQTEKRNTSSPQGGSTVTVNRFKKTTNEISQRAGIRSPRPNNDVDGKRQGTSAKQDDSSGHFSDSILQCLHDVVENFTQTAGARRTEDDVTDDDVGIDEDDVIDYNYSSGDSVDDRIGLRLGNIHDDVTVDRMTNQRNGDNERRDSDGSEFLISRENSGCDESDDGELSECDSNRRHSRQERPLDHRISLKNVSQQTLEDRDTQTALTLHVGHQQLLLPSCKSISLGDWLVLGTSGRSLGRHLEPWNVIENANESTVPGLEMNEKTPPSDPPKECRNFATQTFGQIEDAVKVTCETQTDLLFERHDHEIETRNGFSNGDELDVGTGLVNRTHHERSVNRSGSEERTLNKSISEEVIRVLKETQQLILERAANATKLKNVAKSDEEHEKELPEEGNKKELLKIMLDEVRHLRSHVSQKTSGKSRSTTRAKQEEMRKPKKQERKAESEDSAIESSDDDNYRKDREMELARSRLELLMYRDPVQPTDERDNKENWPWNGRKRDGRYVHAREVRHAPRPSPRETRVEAGQSRSVHHPRHPTNPAHGLDNVDERTSVPPHYNHWSQWGDASPFKRPAYDTQYHNTMYGGRSAFQQPQHYSTAQHPLHPTQLTQNSMFPTQHFSHEPMHPASHFPQHMSAYPEQYLHPSMYDSRQSFAPQPYLSNLVQPQSNFLTPARHHFSQNLNPDENLGSYAGPIRQPTQTFSNHHPTSEPFSSAFRPINGNPKPQFVFVPTSAIQRQEPTIAAVRTGNEHPISADLIPIQSREEPAWVVNPLQARPRDTNETRPHITRGATALQKQQHCGVFDLDSSIRRATKQAKEIKNISDKLLRHSLAQPPRT